MKTILVSALKISIVVLIFYWMIKTDRLHLSDLKIFLTQPSVTLVTIFVWLSTQVFLGTYRWYLLLQGAGISCSYFRALNLQLIGFFFNASMPGAVSGDIIKAVYIVKEQETKSKTPAMLSVLLDRVVGLMGLFMMGLVACLGNFELLWGNLATRNLLVFLVLVVVGITAFLGFIYSPHSDDRDPIIKLLKLNGPGFSTFLKIYCALRGYRKNPGVILKTIFISMVIQFIFLIFMWYLLSVLNGSFPSLTLLASIFPFGILVTAIPIAPGGLGVGHVAFDHLFHLVGLTNGANVFNLFAIGPLILNLLGFIPYLFLKSKIVEDSAAKVPA